MPQPTAGDVHVNAPLTNMSIAFLQSEEGFVSRKAFPTLKVKKQSDRYFQYDKKQWFRSDAKKRAPGTESAGSGFTIDNTPNYFCDVRAIHKDVDDQMRDNADQVIDPDRDATEFVTRDLMLEAELDWAATYFTAGIWTGTTTGTDVTPGTLWSAANSTPIADMRAQIRSVQSKTGFKANIATLAPDVWDILQDHSDFLDRIKYTEKGIVTTDLLAGVLGLKAVYVADAIADAADEGVAENLGFIFSKSVLLNYAAPKPGIMKPSAGYTFAWTGRFGANAAGMRIKRFRMEELSSDRVENESAYDHKLVAPECGAFMLNVIS